MTQGEAQRSESTLDLPGHRGAEGSIRLLRWATVLVLLVAALCGVAFTLHWRMAVDTPVMHYVVFLLRHGLKPYSEITDNNMPGAYLTEAAAMSVFGASDLAWRVYEFFLLGVLALSAGLAARRWDWVAGVFAAGMFLVLHLAEGPQLSVEREMVIGVALMAGCVALFEAVRQRLPSLMVLFGLLCGVAASIKPTYLPLPLGLLILLAVALRRRRLRVLPYVLWAALGLGLVALAVSTFLLRERALPGFFYILRTVVPAYTGLEKPSFLTLLRGVLPRVLLPLLLLALPLFARSARVRDHWNWERCVVAVTAAFGLLSYFAQGKGFLYHRYIFLMFLLLLIGAEIFAALRVPGWPRALAVVALVFALGYVVPSHLRTTHAIAGRPQMELAMEQDLTSLNARSSLQGQVQCFDLVFGCLDALYHLRLVENTGFTGDMLLFTANPSPASEHYRQLFWQLAAQKPAEILVISNGNFGVENSFGKLERWPEFRAYLERNYTQTVERCFPFERYTYHSAEPVSPGDCYRLYLRDGSALLGTSASAGLPPRSQDRPVDLPRRSALTAAQ